MDDLTKLSAFENESNFDNNESVIIESFTKYNCSQNWIAFIVPFRKREIHLPQYLKAIKKHQFYNFQENNYEILVVEQIDTALFNRAKLMNIGAKFAHLHMQEKCNNHTLVNSSLCLIFHDIDMLPLNQKLQYDCHQR